MNEIEDIHHSYLLSVKKNEVEARASLIYSYKQSFNGFTAVLTPEEASKLSSNKQKQHISLFPIINLYFLFISNIETMVLNKLKEVVLVYQSNPRKYSLNTTRSWDFLGLEQGEKKPIKSNTYSRER